ncbi:hypothetical protein ACLOJK_035051, partial [Asimina triloba]
VDGSLRVMWPVAGRVPSRRLAAAIMAPPAAVPAARHYTKQLLTYLNRDFSHFLQSFFYSNLSSLRVFDHLFIPNVLNPT